MSMPSSFRIWLKRRRQERGLTQEQLGESVGYAGQTIAKIEGGQRRPSPQLALRLAEALELPLEERGSWMAAALDEPANEHVPAAIAEATLASPPTGTRLPLWLHKAQAHRQRRANHHHTVLSADRLYLLLVRRAGRECREGGQETG
jgi:putative transcriptional regulator